MVDAPSSSAIFQARLAIGLIVGLLALGVALVRDFSTRVSAALWSDILDRPGGPMTFRFVLQPAMAVIAALRDGVKDARLGRRPFFWALVARRAATRRAAAGVCGRESSRPRRILILGVVMDIIYQWRVFDTFYPGQAAVIAVLLAFVPYLVLRGPFERLARHWVAAAGVRLIDGFERADDGKPRSQIRYEHRARGATHRHVVSAHPHERRPYADVDHSHVAVAD